MGKQVFTYPSWQELSGRYSYDPATGILSRNGKEVGYLNGGYRKVKWGTRPMMVNRVCYSIHHKVDVPNDIEIDHKNRNRSDNSIDNLRYAHRHSNCQNRSSGKISNTGLKGAYHRKSKGDYRAMIMSQGKRKHLGYFSTPEEAHDAYKKAANELHGEYACHT